MSVPEQYHVLDDQIINKDGPVVVHKEFVQGWHPELPNAKLTTGWSGEETVVTETGVRPALIVTVEPADSEQTK